jgi:hypothetical protein
MPSPNGHRAERDGCTCPPWVLRCAHLGNHVVVLADSTLLAPTKHFVLNRWGVADGVMHECSCGCGLRKFGRPGNATYSNDLPAAEAEFRKREAALLERVDVQ